MQIVYDMNLVKQNEAMLVNQSSLWKFGRVQSLSYSGYSEDFQCYILFLAFSLIIGNADNYTFISPWPSYTKNPNFLWFSPSVILL